jgi:hypothetical protein
MTVTLLEGQVLAIVHCFWMDGLLLVTLPVFKEDHCLRVAHAGAEVFGEEVG